MTFENTYPTIITEEVFEKVLQIRKSQQRRMKLSRTSLLSGCLQEGHGKSRMPPGKLEIVQI